MLTHNFFVFYLYIELNHTDDSCYVYDDGPETFAGTLWNLQRRMQSHYWSQTYVGACVTKQRH